MGVFFGLNIGLEVGQCETYHKTFTRRGFIFAHAVAVTLHVYANFFSGSQNSLVSNDRA